MLEAWVSAYSHATYNDRKYHRQNPAYHKRKFQERDQGAIDGSTIAEDDGDPGEPLYYLGGI